MSALPFEAPPRVQREQRYNKSHPCPICGGWQSGGKGHHCYGFLSFDGRSAFCTEIATADGAPAKRNGLYKHLLARADLEELADPLTFPSRPTPRQDPPKRPKPHSSIPHTLRDGWHQTMRFDYRDAGGALLYVKVRYDPPPDRAGEKKRVLSYQPVGEDWIPDEEGLSDRKVLYRLPELLAAKASRPVFIVEGEKCCDELRKIGLVATTNPDGAGKWHVILPGGSLEALRGRTVVILPDNDEQGREHARQVAASLDGIAASIRLMELPDLPEKGDVVDWLAAGGDAVTLLELVIATPAHGHQEEPREEIREPDQRLLQRLEHDRRVTKAKGTAALANLLRVLRPLLGAMPDDAPPDEWVRIDLTATGKGMSKSKATAGKQVAVACERRMLRTRQVHSIDERTGQPRTYLDVARGDLYLMPEDASADGEGSGGAGRGQGRKTCMERCADGTLCGGDLLTFDVCGKCGKRHAHKP